MENASKALIMAGTILIAILVLTVGVYIFINFSEFALSNEEKQAKQELIMENNKFLKYDGRTDLKAQDMKSLTNLVEEYNSKCLEEDKIVIRYGTTNLLQQGDTWWYNLFEEGLIQTKEGGREKIQIQQYKCSIRVKNDNNGNEIVKEIEFIRGQII